MGKQLFLTIQLLLFIALQSNAMPLPYASISPYSSPWDNLYEAQSLEAVMALEAAPSGYESVAWSTESGLCRAEEQLISCISSGYFTKGCEAVGKYKSGDWTFVVVHFSAAYEMRSHLAIVDAKGKVIDAFEFKRSSEKNYGTSKTETRILSESGSFQFLTTKKWELYDKDGAVSKEGTEVVSYTFHPQKGKLEKQNVE